MLIFFMYLSWKKWFIPDVPISDVISWGNNQKSFKRIWQKKGGSKRKKKHDRVQKQKKGKKEQQSNHKKTCEVWEAKSYETAVDMNNNICPDDICEIPPLQTEQTCKELIHGVEYACIIWFWNYRTWYV